ncbi:hypothetical protein JXB11_03225 [Candidatus Woesearchaeota archaeon]|nr:hypothetical protein [Candidatus Woesearchaeota archaeon]
MIGKPEWFERRKYGGWGIHPKKWQGGVYIAAALIPLVVFNALPYWDTTTRIIFTAGWLVLLMLDVTQIMVSLKKDERESKIEAIAERNAAWAMMLVLVIGVLYQAISSALQQKFMVDPFIAGALFLGLIVKSVSNLKLERRELK